jgi:hypothetical protein
VIATAQILVLATVLLVAGIAKLASKNPTEGLAALVRPRFARRLNVTVALAEIAVGIALFVAPVLPVRVVAALMLVTAAGVVLHMRRVRPKAGCGCFGSLSRAPIGWRAVTRTVAFAVLAVAVIPFAAEFSVYAVMIAVVELAVIVAVSPEVAERKPVVADDKMHCSVRRVPHEQTVAALHASAQWREHLPLLDAAEPVEAWREGCWRFFSYPATVDGESAHAVFAVLVEGAPPPVKVALVTATDDRIIRATVPV